MPSALDERVVPSLEKGAQPYALERYFYLSLVHDSVAEICARWGDLCQNLKVSPSGFRACQITRPDVAHQQPRIKMSESTESTAGKSIQCVPILFDLPLEELASTPPANLLLL
jgi:hypothetical protein